MQNTFCTFYSCPYHNNCNRKLQEEIEKQYTYQDEHGKSCDKWESFPTQERSIWEVDEMRAAPDSMEDPILHLAVHLTLVGALREGEVAGLTPDDIDFDAADGMGTFTINKSMQRVQKDTPVRICW